MENNEKERKIYTIGDAHLDTSWVWTFETTVDEYIPRTFNENFSLFEKYPEYKFNFEGSYRYELMKEYYPEQYEKVKEYVKNGRWHTCGSCYENGDVNIPSPEALIRNVIYGNGFFRDEFGTESNDIFLPDCFGFGKALPGVAAHCGLTGFSTQKLTWGCAVPIPFDTGKWTALDGNYIWAAIKTGNYTKVFKEIRTDKNVTDKAERNAQLYGFNGTMEYHGVGDRGGAPKEESVQTVCRELRDNATSRIKVLSSTTKEYFDDLVALPDDIKKKMPVHEGEFLMTEHGAGSYTTRTASKRFNRRCELLADAAERNAVGAFVLGLADYPQNVLDTAWKRTIAHQFHDDITGTSWMIDYKRNWNDYIQSLNQFSTEYTAAIKAITGKMDTSFAKGIAIAVSNPVQSTSLVKQAVSANIDAALLPRYAKVYDSEGNEVPSQITAASKDGIKKVTFIAAVPSNGIALYDIRPEDEPCKIDTGLSMSTMGIENKRFSVKLDKNGDISSVYDKKLEKELLSAPIRAQLISDIEPYHYSAWEVKYKDIMRKPYAYASKPVCFIADEGPALCTLEIIRKAGKSVIKQFISLDVESDFVKVYNEVDWRTESSNLKICFPTSCSNDIANYDIGIGYYGRKTNTENAFEVPAQRWADLTNEDKSYGVSILSDSRFGWDKPDDKTLRLTVVHCATNYHSYMTCQNVADFGLNRFSFAITGHENNPDSVPCAADRFCQPMHTFICDNHKGELGKDFSLCSLTSDTVRILGIKKAQKSDEIVIRLCEYTGNKQENIGVDFLLPVKEARNITGDEMPLDDITVNNGKMVLDFEPHQIRSVAVTLDGAKKYNPTYGAAELSLDFETSTTDGENLAKLPVDLSIPAELIPDTLVEGGIGYNLVKTGCNATLCKGQSIKVPTGAKSLHLILTSVSGDRFAVFETDGDKKEVVVQDCLEAVGAWDIIPLKEMGYIKKLPQYFTFTHTHNKDGNVTARQLYLFHAEIAVNGKDTVIFPDDDRIIVFAASFSSDENKAVPADEHFDSLEKREFDYTVSGYAEKHFEETKFVVKMDSLIKKIDSDDVRFTPDRRKKLSHKARSFKDNSVKRRQKLRTKKLVLCRKLKLSV